LWYDTCPHVSTSAPKRAKNDIKNKDYANNTPVMLKELVVQDHKSTTEGYVDHGDMHDDSNGPFKEQAPDESDLLVEDACREGLQDIDDRDRHKLQQGATGGTRDHMHKSFQRSNSHHNDNSLRTSLSKEDNAVLTLGQHDRFLPSRNNQTKLWSCWRVLF
jgi:hypothetical protein